MGYQERDWDVVDHQAYNLLPDEKYSQFKGPRHENLKKGEYIACVGAAQTFGCYTDKPFATLLQQRLETPVLNLGVGGASAEFFLLRPALLEYINNARFAIVQVMSGRSVGNSRFTTNRGKCIYTPVGGGDPLRAEKAFQKVLEEPDGEKTVARLAAENRENWVNVTNRLLDSIRVPTILLWISVRKPAYEDNYTSISNLFNKFPQLINEPTLKRVIAHSDEYVECISDRNMPYTLINRFTGEVAKIDPKAASRRDTDPPRDPTIPVKTISTGGYYPSPEMHEDAADLLEPICRKLLGQTAPLATAQM